jgi:hypothetical protein
LRGGDLGQGIEDADFGGHGVGRAGISRRAAGVDGRYKEGMGVTIL